jgi:hypothetical protein
MEIQEKSGLKINMVEKQKKLKMRCSFEEQG